MRIFFLTLVTIATLLPTMALSSQLPATENATSTRALGDVDNNGSVNVSDVTTLINMILGTVPLDLNRADIDSNGTVNVSDVTALIYIILNTHNNRLVLIADNFNFQCGLNGENRTTYQQMSTYVYKVLNCSKDEFHSLYSRFEDVNDIYQGKADVGTVEELNAGDNSSQEGTHVLKWTISEQDLWDYAGKSVSNVVRYRTGDGSRNVEIVLTANIDGIQKNYNVSTSQLINEYWNDDKSFTRFNVQVPQSTYDRDPDNCVFVNDLNSPFVTENGVLALDKAITTFNYFFSDDMKGTKEIGGKTYNFTLADNGLTLKANGEIVAQICNDHYTLPFNYVTYNKNSQIAKDLLNTGEMSLLFKAIGFACYNPNKPIGITFNGQDHFCAKLIVPVKITEQAADNFIDGVDVGEKGSFIKIEDLIAPSDWRGRSFSGHDNYWDFYGPFSVEFDRKDAECDLNGVRRAVPATIELAQTNTTSMGGVTSKYGFITYKNNGTVLNTNFNLFVKVTVTYGWGAIKTDWITIPVKATSATAALRK